MPATLVCDFPSICFKLLAVFYWEMNDFLSLITISYSTYMWLLHGRLTLMQKKGAMLVRFCCTTDTQQNSHERVFFVVVVVLFIFQKSNNDCLHCICSVFSHLSPIKKQLFSCGFMLISCVVCSTFARTYLVVDTAKHILPFWTFQTRGSWPHLSFVAVPKGKRWQAARGFRNTAIAWHHLIQFGSGSFLISSGSNRI